MEDWIIDRIDNVLTVIFWLPAKIIGYEKCQKCTIRVRWAQAMLLATTAWPIRELMTDQRIEWEARIAAREDLKKAVI